MMAIYELDNEQEYEAAVSQCVRVTGYHHWFFLSAMAEALNLEFRAFAIDSGGERLGVVPLLFRRRGPVSIVNYLPVGCIGPLLSGDALRAGRMRELVGAVMPVLRGHRAIVTNWAFSPGLNVRTEQLAMPGFDVYESENYVISAGKSVDDCFKSMSRVRRQSIRQSEARGLAVAESTIEEIMGWLPGQMSEAHRRQGAAPSYKLAEARSLTEKLAGHPRMLWRTVKAAEGNVLGMAGCVVGDERLWGWLIAGPPVPGISPQSLCYWDLIKWSLPQGLAFDLGGVPTDGIRKFKISMGADVETCVAAVRVRPRAAYQVARACYNWAMRRVATGRGG
jgi:CelD/BcsL family acetyltransferase involved in cellulose biosynthesis